MKGRDQDSKGAMSLHGLCKKMFDVHTMNTTEADLS